MSAREENQIKLENKANDLIKDCPRVVKSFIKSRDSARTKLNYAKYMVHFMEYLDDNGFEPYKDDDFYKKITALDMVEYNDFIKYKYEDGKKIVAKEATRAVKLASVKSFFNFLLESNLITTNPCSNIKPPRMSEDKEIVALTKEEADLIRHNIKNGVGSMRAQLRQDFWRTRDLAIFNLACATGLRVTAITEINMDDLDLENNVIHVVEKENKIKDVIIGENLKFSIQQWINDRYWLLGYNKCDALFITSQMKRINVVTIIEMLKKYSVGIDKPVTPHKLRSTYATNLYEQTGDIYLVQNMLGHKSAETTKRYAKLNTEKKIKAAEIADQF